VLGIDNIIFISILVDKLPPAQRELARRIGLFMAMFMRIGLLLVLAWIVGLVAPLFTVFGRRSRSRPDPDPRRAVPDLEEHHRDPQSLEGEEGQATSAVKATFAAVILQIMVIDLVFSLDSIITAVGMVDDVRIMIAAVIASVALMMLFAGPIGRFVSDHPTIKMLALSFLVVVGVVLVAEGFDHHVPKGYVYFAMAFSLGVEMLNITRMRKRVSVVAAAGTGTGSSAFMPTMTARISTTPTAAKGQGLAARPWCHPWRCTKNWRISAPASIIRMSTAQLYLLV
jgi:predicted tellurium resistance membrane protein TerC